MKRGFPLAANKISINPLPQYANADNSADTIDPPHHLHRPTRAPGIREPVPNVSSTKHLSEAVSGVSLANNSPTDRSSDGDEHPWQPAEGYQLAEAGVGSVNGDTSESVTAGQCVEISSGGEDEKQYTTVLLKGEEDLEGGFVEGEAAAAFTVPGGKADPYGPK